MIKTSHTFTSIEQETLDETVKQLFTLQNREFATRNRRFSSIKELWAEELAFKKAREPFWVKAVYKEIVNDNVYRDILLRSIKTTSEFIRAYKIDLGGDCCEDDIPVENKARAQILGSHVGPHPLPIGNLVGELYLRYFLREFGLNANTKFFSRHSSWVNPRQQTEKLNKIVWDSWDGISLYRIRGESAGSVSMFLRDKEGNIYSGIASIEDALICFADSLNSGIHRWVVTEEGFREWEPSDVHHSPKRFDEAKIALVGSTPIRIQVLEPLYASLDAPRKYFMSGYGGQFAIRGILTGNIDLYADPFSGQPIHKIIHLFVAQKGGIVVKGADGDVFLASELLEELEKNPEARYEFYAARTSELCNSAMEELYNFRDNMPLGPGELNAETKRHFINHKETQKYSRRSLVQLIQEWQRERNVPITYRLLNRVFEIIDLGKCEVEDITELLSIEIPGYSPVGKLGEGGSRYVYLTKKENADVLYVLKVFKTVPTGTRGRDQLGRHTIEEIVKREGDELAKLNHPNLIRYFDHRPYGDTWYVLEEYVEGKDAERLSPELDEEGMRKIFTAILDGTAYLHSKRRVVRDIKLDNVIVSNDWNTIKMTDLQFIGDLRMIIESRSVTSGSLRYAAPELVQNGDATATFQSDVYSIGVCLYYMLSKETKSVSTLNTLSDDAYGQKLSEMLNLVDPKYRNFLQRSLSYDPNKRFNSAQEMKSHFEQIRPTNSS